MSTTTKPVTQTAEVAVKKAFTGLVSWPVLLEIGNISKMVPSAIKQPKPYINTKDDEATAFTRGITERETRHGLVLAGRNDLSPGSGLRLCCMYITSEMTRISRRKSWSCRTITRVISRTFLPSLQARACPQHPRAFSSPPEGIGLQNQFSVLRESTFS